MKKIKVIFIKIRNIFRLWIGKNFLIFLAILSWHSTIFLYDKIVPLAYFLKISSTMVARAIYFVNIFVFIIIGIFTGKLIRKKFSRESIFLTIPLIIPLSFLNLVSMTFGGTGKEPFTTILLVFGLAFTPMVSYILGLIIAYRKK